MTTKSTTVEYKKRYEPTTEQLTLLGSWGYHAPHEDQQDRYVAINDLTARCAELMCELAPASRELSLAITKLREARMWANAAIACNEK